MPKKRIKSAKKPKKEFGSRKFGVEIECVGLTVQEAQKFLNDSGISVYLPSEANRSQYRKWNVKYDGSIRAPQIEESASCQYCTINNRHNCYYCGRTGFRRAYVIKGCEIVSPILSGEKGLQEIKKVCDLLVSKNVKANDSCGLHVHVNAKGISREALTGVYNRYCQFEKQIDKFVKPSRREDKNEYCFSPTGNYVDFDFNFDYDYNLNKLKKQIQSLYNVFIKNEIKTPEDKKNKRKMTNIYFDIDRHCKINLSSFNSTGTVEFRQHHGTVNAKEITDWVKFCVQFFEQSIKPKKRKETDSLCAGIDSSVIRALKQRFPARKKVVKKLKTKIVRPTLARAA